MGGIPLDCVVRIKLFRWMRRTYKIQIYFISNFGLFDICLAEISDMCTHNIIYVCTYYFNSLTRVRNSMKYMYLHMYVHINSLTRVCNSLKYLYVGAFVL